MGGKILWSSLIMAPMGHMLKCLNCIQSQDLQTEVGSGCNSRQGFLIPQRFSGGKRKIHFCHNYNFILTLHILKHLQFHQLSGLLGHFLSLISIIWDKRNQFVSTLKGTQGTVFISILCRFAPTFVAFPSKGRQCPWEFTVNTFFLWQTHIRIRFHI